MKLSFIFELLLIFILIAFAASAIIVEPKDMHEAKKRFVSKHGTLNKMRQNSGANRYCSCNKKLCNCCREFNIPVVSLQGPGCASLQYLEGDRLAISMSFGERILTNTTISSKSPQPICMPLPGGVSKFCGRVYNIGRKGEDFKACLGLELRALKQIEASVRVSCFKFGPTGLKVEPSQPLPVVKDEENEDNDDDYDDDEFDFDDDDDDDDEDDDDNELDASEYGGFSVSVIDDDFIDEYFQSGPTDLKKKRPAKPPKPSPTKGPSRQHIRKPSIKPSKTQPRKPPRIKVVSKNRPNLKSTIYTPTTPAVKSTQTYIKTTQEILPEEHFDLTSQTSLQNNVGAPQKSVVATTVMPENSQRVNLTTAEPNLLVSVTSTLSNEETTTGIQSHTTLNVVTGEEVTVTEGIIQEEHITMKNVNKERESEESLVDPIAEIVDDIVNENDKEYDKTNITIKNAYKTTTLSTKISGSAGVLDAIMNDVVDTIVGDNTSIRMNTTTVASSTMQNTGDVSDDSDENNNDEVEENEDEDDEQRDDKDENNDDEKNRKYSRSTLSK